MNLSMYTAAAGSKAQQSRIDVIANNLANLHTDGYRSQSAGFVDLLYQNYEAGITQDPDIGCGSRMEKTDISFEPGTIQPTDGTYDFAINGPGFFAIYDRAEEDVRYTRNGAFHLGDFGNGNFYLMDQNDNFVLDREMALISLVGGNEGNHDLNIGVFDFISKEGFLALGNNYYAPVEKSGQPFLRQDAQVLQGRLETANVDMANEMARVIESQRAYQMTIKMINTSDEVEQTINNLR